MESGGPPHRDRNQSCRVGRSLSGRGRLLGRHRLLGGPARVFSNRTSIYDTPDAALRHCGELGGIRHDGGEPSSPSNPPPSPAGTSAARNWETRVSDGAVLEADPRTPGVAAVFPLRKVPGPNTAARAGNGVVTLDETPIRCLLSNSQGPAAWIDEAAP